MQGYFYYKQTEESVFVCISMFVEIVVMIQQEYSYAMHCSAFNDLWVHGKACKWKATS